MDMPVDFHTHLLPAIDDGSRNVEESLALLKTLSAQKVCIAVATPHFYSRKTSLADFLERRNQAYDLLCTARESEAPQVLLGAEVSFFRGIGKAERLEKLCIGDTKALLLEMPFAQWGRGEIAELHQLLARGITPILAHIERYCSYQKDMTALNEIINLPVFLQVNTEALQTGKTRRFVFRLIKSGFAILLGTDCHGLEHRSPDMDAGREILARKFGSDCLAQIDAQATQLLNVK